MRFWRIPEALAKLADVFDIIQASDLSTKAPQPRLVPLLWPVQH